MEDSTGDSFDAIIVGAGFAGLTAARELRYRGLRPLVLEARERLGGRTLTAEFGGMPVELGGQSIHWTHAHVWTELARYGIGIVENAPWTTFVMWEDGRPRNLTRAEAGKKLVRLFTLFFDGIQTAISRPFDPMLNREAMERIDAMSLKDRLDQLDLTSDERAWFEAFLIAISGWPLDRAGLACFVWMWALAGASLPRMLESMGRYSIEGGTIRLLNAIADDVPLHIRINMPIARIRAIDGAVEVTTREGRMFSAPACIVATPVSLWPHIDFSGDISEEKLAAAREGILAPAFTKIWIVASGEVDHVMAVFPPDRAITQLRVDRRRADGRHMIIAFSVDPGFDPADHDSIRKAVLEVLPQARVEEIMTQAWHEEEFSRGSFNWMQPGQMIRYFDELQRPEGRLFFATSDIADGPGGLGGAIESGVRAARQLMATLSEPARR